MEKKRLELEDGQDKGMNKWKAHASVIKRILVKVGEIAKVPASASPSAMMACTAIFAILNVSGIFLLFTTPNGLVVRTALLLLPYTQAVLTANALSDTQRARCRRKRRRAFINLKYFLNACEESSGGVLSASES